MSIRKKTFVFLIFLATMMLSLVLAGCGGGNGGGGGVTLIRLQITPAVSEISVGARLSYTATGVYSDNTTRNLTSQAAWQSSLTAIATIDNAGVATGAASGITAISATVSGITGTAALSVDSATLTSIQVTPGTSEIPAGKTTAFTAIGTYSDGGTHDLTALVAWTSSNNARATVAQTGVATAVSAGTATITATLGNLTSSALLTVDASVLTNIVVHPATPEIARSAQVAFAATGSYSDGDTHDLTTQVAWTSSTPSIATISSAGVATGMDAGETTITALLGGVTGTAQLRVDSSRLTSIQILPQNPSIARQATQPFKATGTYSDGDTKDLTAQVSWTAGNPLIATVESGGKATGLAAGSTPIVATMSGVSGSTTLTVTGSSGVDFPTYAGNVFSIQYRNSSSAAISVWFIGSKPPCSRAVTAASSDNCATGNLPSNYSADWTAMSAQFTASGTTFYIRRTNGTLDAVSVSNKVNLQPGEVLRVVPPIVTGTDPVTGNPYTRPEWFYNQKVYDAHGNYVRTDTQQTSGTTTWVTKTGIAMPAPQSVMLYEFNLSAYSDKNIWYDIGAVDGLNANATMSYTGCATQQQKSCKTNIQAYNGTNDGCPYIMQMSSANVCPNPKLYPETFNAGPRPSWVVAPSSYTTASVSTTYASYWTAAGSPSGAAMASAASGDATMKKAYHIWWATNPVGQGWLAYLQKNSAGLCDAYGWAYDEKRLVTSECNPNTASCFDVNGNPADNKDVQALISCPYSVQSYLNIDILDVM